MLGGPKELGQCNPAEIWCLIAHGKEDLGPGDSCGTSKRLVAATGWAGLFLPQMPHDPHPCTGRNWGLVLPALVGRKGRGGSIAPSTALGSPTLTGATGSPTTETCLSGNTALLQGTAEPPESPFGPHMPSQGAELGQNLTFPRHIHEPVGAGKESPARTQPLVPTAMWSWLLLPSKQVLQAQPEAAHPVIPLCYRENPKCWLGCWKRAPPPIPPCEGHSTAS